MGFCVKHFFISSRLLFELFSLEFCSAKKCKCWSTTSKGKTRQGGQKLKGMCSAGSCHQSLYCCCLLACNIQLFDKMKCGYKGSARWKPKKWKESILYEENPFFQQTHAHGENHPFWATKKICRGPRTQLGKHRCTGSSQKPNSSDNFYLHVFSMTTCTQLHLIILRGAPKCLQTGHRLSIHRKNYSPRCRPRSTLRLK